MAATRHFVSRTGTEYSLRAIERDLVAYMHGEATDVPAAVIAEAIDHEPAIAEAWAEWQAVADMLGYLPSVRPSRHFVRELVQALPALRADGRASARLEDLVLRTKWTVEDRLAFAVEHWRYRFRHHPVRSAVMAAAALLLVVTVAWLPGAYLLPPGTVPAIPGLPAGSGPMAAEAEERDRQADEPDWVIPPPADDDAATLDDSRVEPELVLGPQELRGFDDVMMREPVPRFDVPDYRVPQPPVRHGGVRELPPGGLPLPAPEVLPWNELRQQHDEARQISRQQRELIDLGLRWLAANQNADGSWGHAESVRQRWEAERRRRRASASADADADTVGEPHGVLGPQQAPPSQQTETEAAAAGPAGPMVVQTTARALLAFLADNYGSRASRRADLNPRRSRHSPIRESDFAAHVDKMRQAVLAGLTFLQANADPATGRLCAPGHASVLAHAEGLMALAEDYQIAGTYRLRPTMDAAVDYLLAVRNLDGGWGNEPGSASSAQATLAAIQALVMYTKTPAAALPINSPVFRQAARFLVEHANALVYARPPRSAAAALALHQVLSVVGLEPERAAFDARDSLGLLAQPQHRPRWRRDAILGSTPVDFDYWLYASQALASLDDSTAATVAVARGLGEDWRRAMDDALATNRIVLADEDGRGPGAVYWPVSEPLQQVSGLGVAWVSASAVLALQNRYRYAWLRE